MSAGSEGTRPPAPKGPIALDGLAYGIDHLDAILVFRLGDARIHATWVRASSGLRDEDIVGALRDAYRASQLAARRLTSGADRLGERVEPLVSIEIPHRLALLRRIRSLVVACLFDAAMPLGMARVVAARLAGVLEPELPLTEEPPTLAPRAPTIAPRSPTLAPRAPTLAPPAAPLHALREGEAHHDDAQAYGPSTLAFGDSRRAPRTEHATPGEQSRIRALLAYLDANAPEPHVVRLRLALRAGISPMALDRPDRLGPEALVLIETAVEDILGQSRAELARIA